MTALQLISRAPSDPPSRALPFPWLVVCRLVVIGYWFLVFGFWYVRIFLASAKITRDPSSF